MCNFPIKLWTCLYLLSGPTLQCLRHTLHWNQTAHDNTTPQIYRSRYFWKAYIVNLLAFVKSNMAAVMMRCVPVRCVAAYECYDNVQCVMILDTMYEASSLLQSKFDHNIRNYWVRNITAHYKVKIETKYHRIFLMSIGVCYLIIIIIEYKQKCGIFWNAESYC